MDGLIVQGWLWRLRSWRRSGQNLPILFEECVDEGDHLAGNPPNDFEFSFVGAGPFIVDALERNQAFRHLSTHWLYRPFPTLTVDSCLLATGTPQSAVETNRLQWATA